MIKLFRKTREALLKENRFGKYLVYAVGEIVLVVAGILIALSINNRNEIRKNERITKSILNEIQNNLLDDISNAQLDMDDFMKSWKSQLEILDFNNPRTEEGYKNGDYKNLGGRPFTFVTNNNGYENLSRQIDIIPENYGELLSELKTLYVELRGNINVSNDRIRKIVFKEKDFLSNQNWDIYRIKTHKPSKEEIDYYINDDQYKRYILQFMKDRFVIFRSSQNYRLKAISIYLKIDSLMQNPTPLNNETLNMLGRVGTNDGIDQYLGSYCANGSDTFQYFKEGSQLYSITNNEQISKSAEYLLTDKKFMHMNDKNSPVIWKFITDSAGTKSISFEYGKYDSYKILNKIK